MSLGVAVGGSVALLLTRAGSGAAAYVDPLLVLIACAAIAPMAIGLVRDGVRELLEAAPLPKVRDEIDTVVAAARAEHDLPTPITRATKLGRRLYAEVDFVVAPGAWSVDDEDAVRHSIIDRLRELDYEVWATVELTTDVALADD
jgi:predicted Co/Zn/Cd cation transporter (cation efflux family)